MRRIVSGLFISLDGVYEAPDPWHFPYFNDEIGEAVRSQMAAADTMLLGRVTYQESASFFGRPPVQPQARAADQIPLERGACPDGVEDVISLASRTNRQTGRHRCGGVCGEVS
ncbi:MAG: hypothetical protein ACRDJC_08350 [Thermomicrobiales bacterium]